jgi:hypothetical protein
MNDKVKKDPQLHHVKITVLPNQDGSYEIRYEPKTVRPTDHDAIITCKLAEPTPKDIIITSCVVSPEPNDQISTPTISKNQRSITVSDVNTEKGTFHLSISYGSLEARSAIRTSAAASLSVIYPEVDNEPPH